MAALHSRFLSGPSSALSGEVMRRFTNVPFDATIYQTYVEDVAYLRFHTVPAIVHEWLF